MFIVLEGIDGTGKTTQAKLLKEYFEEKGYQVELVREPGGTPFAEQIRSLILDPDNKPQSKNTLTFLFEAARTEIVEGKIRPALEAGKIVICDRFTESTLAYQFFKSDFNETDLKILNIFAVNNVKPDIVILFDADPEKIYERRTGRIPDRFELEGLEFQKKLRKRYLSIKRESRIRHQTVNAEKSLDEVQQNLRYILKRNFKIG